MGFVARLGLEEGIGLHGGVVVLVEAVCEPFEGVADAHLEGAEALGVALQGYLYRRCIIEEVVEEGPPAGSVGLRISPSRCHDIPEMILTSIFLASSGVFAPHRNARETQNLVVADCNN